MTTPKKILASFRISKLDGTAIAFATLLSLACLVRGAVHDGVVALLLLGAMPILFIGMRAAKPIHTSLAMVGGLFTLALVGVLGLQWTASSTLTNTPGLFLDHGAWIQSLGHLCYMLVSFVLALFIGATESSARTFIRSLLISGSFFLTLTFLFIPRESMPVSAYYSYAHGFVNPNNAAAYLGLILLLTLAQVARLLKFRVKNIHKWFVDLVDQASFSTIAHWVFLLFTLLLVLAGLFMTGSRGGILLSLLSSALFCLLIILKMSSYPQTRKAILFSTALIFTSALLWGFMNYGQMISNKLARDGIDSNMRLDVYKAVLPMIADHPWLGVGLGGFPAAFQQYRPDSISSDGIIDKAHNSYLEFAAEMGLPALLILMIIAGWLGYLLFHGVKSRQERYIVPALGLCVWGFAAVYSLVDFPLQIPGLGAIFIAVITVCVCQADPRFCISTPSSHAPMKRRRIRKRLGSSHAG